MEGSPCSEVHPPEDFFDFVSCGRILTVQFNSNFNLASGIHFLTGRNNCFIAGKSNAKEICVGLERNLHFPMMEANSESVNSDNSGVQVDFC